MTGALFDIKLLEGALKWWEDRAFTKVFLREAANDAHMHKQTAARILGFGDEFRSYLLRAATNKSAVFDPKFILSPDSVVSTVGGALYNWNALSRRVFCVSDELRVMLEATRLNSVAWRDVPWPFDSFLLAFETPVVLTDEYHIGGVLFCKSLPAGFPKFQEQYHGECGVVSLPVALQTYTGITDKQKQRLIRAYQHKDEQVCNNWIGQYTPRMSKVGASPFWCALGGRGWENDSVAHQVGSIHHAGSKNDLVAQMGDRVGTMIRFCAAFSFYLTTLQVGSREREQHLQFGPIPPAIPSNDPRLVSLRSNVCRVTSSYTLKSGDKEAMEDAMARERRGEVVPHWRRGHFRRPPGQGNNPEAKRTVWVEPCFVNRKHLPDGVLPGGALVHVLAPEDEREFEII